jgi:hypothetical protein
MSNGSSGSKAGVLGAPRKAWGATVRFSPRTALRPISLGRVGYRSLTLA